MLGSFLVVDNHDDQHLVGVITDRDITIRCVARHHEPGCSVHDHMTAHSLQSVHPEDPEEAVIAKMESAQVRRLPVIDDDRRLLGIVAQADIATKLGPRRPLEVVRMLERVSEPAHVPR